MQAIMRPKQPITPERLIALIRSVFLLTVLALIKLGAGNFKPIIQVNIDILALAGVIYIVLTTFLQSREFSTTRKRAFVALDFLFISVIVLRTGGFHSNFVLLYLLPIVQSSVRHKLRDAAITASAACLIQVILAVSQGLNTQIVAPMYWRASLYIGLSGFLWLFLVQLARESKSHHRRLTELTSLVRLTSTLTSSLDIDQTSEASLDIIVPLFDAQIAAISLVRDDGNLITKASRGLSETNWAAVRRLTKEIVDSGKTQVVERKLSFASTDGHPGLSRVFLLLAPLVVREETIGVLAVGKEDPLPWSYPEIVLCRTVADRIAVYIDTATLYNETKRLAITDELTGAHNHRYFQARIEEEIKRADRYSRPLSLIMVDVDYFKKYNDTHGHLMGDEVLKGVANTLKRWTRIIDVVSRYGGDEFTVLLPETDEEGAMTVAKRLKREIEETYFPLESSQPSGSITVSMGIASFPENGMSAKELIKHADDAMYKAKEKRNTICSAASQFSNIVDIMNQLATKWDRT
ncbi:MAG: diguanylate cyclase [bacterium]